MWQSIFRGYSKSDTVRRLASSPTAVRWSMSRMTASPETSMLPSYGVFHPVMRGGVADFVLVTIRAQTSHAHYVVAQL